MKSVLLFLLIISTTVSAQKLKKADNVIIDALKYHITYLADDKLEGRKTGSAGEKLAYQYIGSEFTKAGLTPKGNKGTFIQEFEINDGREVNETSYLNINDKYLTLYTEYFPLSCSPDIVMETSAAIALQESSAPWFYDIKELLEKNKSSFDYNFTDELLYKANSVAKKGATVLFIYNSSNIKDNLELKRKLKTTDIPIIYITPVAKSKYLNNETATLDIKLNISLSDKIKYGHNILGYIDNAAPTTAIIAANYNASNSAIFIELSKMIKKSKLKKNNYLFITFSGEELGLLGAKYFAANPTIDLTTANYMLNINMMNVYDSAHILVVEGLGSSLIWPQITARENSYFSISLNNDEHLMALQKIFNSKKVPLLSFHSFIGETKKLNSIGELQMVKYLYDLIEAANKKGRFDFIKPHIMEETRN